MKKTSCVFRILACSLCLLMLCSVAAPLLSVAAEPTRYEFEAVTTVYASDGVTPVTPTVSADPDASGGFVAGNTGNRYFLFENMPEGNCVHIAYASVHTYQMDFLIRYPGEDTFTALGQIPFSTSNSWEMSSSYVAISPLHFIPEGSDILIRPNIDCNMDYMWITTEQVGSTNAPANVLTSTMLSNATEADAMSTYDGQTLHMTAGDSVTFTIPESCSGYNVVGLSYRSVGQSTATLQKGNSPIGEITVTETSRYAYASAGFRTEDYAAGDRMTLTCTEGDLYVSHLFFNKFAVPTTVTVPAVPSGERTTVDLDGIWEFGTRFIDIYGRPDEVPSDVDFVNSIPVPGLWDNASADAGDYKINTAWYKKKVILEEEPTEQVLLYIESARYGRHIYVNGEYVDSYEYNYSRSYTDLTGYLHQGENEIVVMLGEKTQQMRDPDSPAHVLDDGESSQSEPGFTGSVALVFNQSPEVSAVQTKPDIDKGELELLISLLNRKDEDLTTDVTVTVYELGVFENGVPNQDEVKVCEQTFSDVAIAAGETYKHSCTVSLDNWSKAKCWDLDSPFLYRVEIKTSGDTYSIRTAMRTFDFDPETHYARLNGEIFFLTGTNVAIERYFDDPLVGTTPWQEDWIRKLYTEFKETNWVSFRTHLGHAPDLWFDLADEMGMLIFDERPFWGSPRSGLTIDDLMPEIYSWIDARGYRPSLVVFDAQNESTMPIFIEIITRGREYDLQRRPWDNGWNHPVGENDAVECHPYIIGNNGIPGLANMTVDRPIVTTIDVGWNVADYPNHAYIINEHGEYWISRDGQPMSAITGTWDKVLPGATNEERLTYYADLMAAQIEMFRTGRAYSGIQFFCGLTSSPSGAHGVTCDVLSPDVSTAESLQIRPYTKERLHDAFAELGISVNFFDDRITRGSRIFVPVTLINDTGEDIVDLPVTLMFKSGDTVLYKEVVYMSVDAFSGGKTGLTTEEFRLVVPGYHDYCENKSVITVSASYEIDGDVISSERDFGLLGGPFVEGEPPVYEDETTTDVNTDTETETETEYATENESVLDTTVADTETVADSTAEETETTEPETTSASEPAGCKAALPAVALMIPVTYLPLLAHKRKKNGV